MYERIISYATSVPWALEERTLATISNLLSFRARGGRLSPEEIQANISAAPHHRPSSSGSRSGAIAVIPILGIITHRAESFDAISGGTPAQVISAQLRRARDHEDITAIVLDVSSPGGEVSGVQELADEIYATRSIKPVVAISNAIAASAAYWLASQASEFLVTPSGEVGSIGVYQLLIDASKQLEQEGIKINAISAGERKLEGAPWQPLSEDSRAHLKKQVDAVYRQFVAHVARGRGVSIDRVELEFGQGRMYGATEAVRRGMADRVGTLDLAINTAATKGTGRGGRRADDAQRLADMDYCDIGTRIRQMESSDDVDAVMRRIERDARRA